MLFNHEASNGESESSFSPTFVVLKTGFSDSSDQIIEKSRLRMRSWKIRVQRSLSTNWRTKYRQDAKNSNTADKNSTHYVIGRC